jgi:N4-gp56 family major capsid protein
MTSTTGLTALMQTFYDKDFLEREVAMTVYDIGAQKKKMQKNMGKTVNFTRFSPLAAATTALTEGTTPSGSDMTANTVSATIAEHGDYVKVSSLFEVTSIDEGLREHVAVLAQQCAYTVDTLIAKELSGSATAQLAGGKSAITDVAATDTLTGAEIRKAVRTLKKNKARPFANNHFKAIVPVSAAYDLRGNSEWLDASRYTDTELIKNGLLGRLHGVEFSETNNEVFQDNAGASSADIYHTYVFGQNAYGVLNLEGQPEKRIIVKKPTESDTSNPLDMYSTIAWKVYFVAKTLNANWVVAIKSGVTA